MRPETKRFIVILTCTFVAFFIVDFGVNWVRNVVQEGRVHHITVGMTEGEAARRLGVQPHELSTGVTESFVWNHESVFDRLILQKMTSTGWSIKIESGKVVSVDMVFIYR